MCICYYLPFSEEVKGFLPPPGMPANQGTSTWWLWDGPPWRAELHFPAFSPLYFHVEWVTKALSQHVGSQSMWTFTLSKSMQGIQELLAFTCPPSLSGATLYTCTPPRILQVWLASLTKGVTFSHKTPTSSKLEAGGETPPWLPPVIVDSSLS